MTIVTAASEDGRISSRVGGARWKAGWSTYPFKGADGGLMDSEVMRRDNITDCQSIYCYVSPIHPMIRQEEALTWIVD